MTRPRHLQRLLPYVAGHRARLTVGLACLLLTTVFAVGSPWVLRHAIDDLTLQITSDKLRGYAALVVAIVLAEGFFRYHMRMILIGVSREVEYELRNDLVAHLTRLAPGYYQKHRVGDIMSRATSDMSAVRMVLGPGLMYTASTLATFAGTAVLMLRISPVLLGLALLPLVLVSVLVRHFGRRIHGQFELVQAQLAEMSVRVQENLAGVRVVRAYAQEAAQRARFEEANQEYQERNRALIALTGALYPGIQVLMGLGAVMVLWVGGRMAVSGWITVGEFVAFGAYLAMLHWPMIAIGWVVNLFERGDASMGRLAEILDAPPSIVDGPLAPETISGDVEFRGLTFSFDGAPVLHDIDLVVPAGSTVAIVGPTGAGKSTLVGLIPRWHDAPPGTLFVGGYDVRDLRLDRLRAGVGFVPQETFLFSATVGQNVALGLPDEDRARVEWAASVAQLSRDVADFPKGFDTFVGERGITLSGGQKQRTALARALAVDAPILVLDDALASVDTDTEERILQGLREVTAGRTTFLVSHRVSTVRHADQIVVLREGRIRERGTHDELLRQGGFYADLHQRQLLEQEVATA